MKALVLGCTGFLGRALVARLRSQGIPVVCGGRATDLDRGFDLTASGPWEDLLDEVDTVFHLAWSGGPELALQYPRATHGCNVEGSLRLAAALRARPSLRVVFPSSGGTLYGDRPDPAREQDPVFPTGPYAEAKWLVERHLLANLPGPAPDVRILRIANVYGPAPRERPAPGVVATFVERLRARETVEVWGRSVVRDFVHIEDVIEAMIRSAELPAGDLPRDRILNIGSGQGVALEALIDLLQELRGDPFPVSYQSPRPQDLARSVLDISRARSCLGWKPRISLPEGLRGLLEA